MNDVVTFFWDFGGHPTRHVLGSAHKRPLGRLPSARSRHIESMAQNFNIFQPIPKIWKPGHIYIYIYHLSSREMNGHDTWSMHRSVTTLNSDFVILICKMNFGSSGTQKKYTAYGTWNTQEPPEITSGSFWMKLQGRSCTGAVLSSLANHLEL